MSKEVGKNKSSFYHLFADLEVFTTALLDYHLEQSRVIAKKESKCETLEELIGIIVAHKIDLLFNRQLRVHRENIEFEKYFLKVNNISIPAILPIWSKLIELNDNSYLAELVLRLSLENFFLQITDETLNTTWLHEYFKGVKTLVRQFKMTGSVTSLDGSV
ncbi:MAG: hypothetical protein WA913_11060 [Pricia sp.]